jgi:hypothetical protein
MTEIEQEIGRNGVKRVRRLLDGTMRFQMPYDIYENPERVILPLLAEGKTKSFDLRGHYSNEKGDAGSEIYVEAKNYADAGNQASEFTKFLAWAYSATMQRQTEIGLDPKFEFMWATTCPWKGSGFREVASREAVRKAIEGAGEEIIPAGHTLDEAMADALVDRLWVWVICDRQEEMVLNGQMRSWIAAKWEELR